MLLITLFLTIVVLSMVAYALNKAVGFIALQISLALFIVYLIYWSSLWILKRDKLVIDTSHGATGNGKTMIVAGYADSFNLQNTVIDTINPSAQSYANLPRSANRYGGAQFSYQFWLLVSNVDPANIGTKDILVHGDTTSYNLMTVDNVTNTTSIAEDMIIKCPRIRFNGTFDSFAVEINTLADPNPPPIVISSTPSTGDSTSKHNLLKLTPNKWVLYTYVFQDNVGVNDFENGIEVQFYVNDILYQSSTMLSTLRQNNGNLYLFPSGPIAGCQIGDLAYYNYAVDVGTISKVYNAGPPAAATAKSSGPLATPLFLSEYNKLDIYNS